LTQRVNKAHAKKALNRMKKRGDKWGLNPTSTFRTSSGKGEKGPKKAKENERKQNRTMRKREKKQKRGKKREDRAILISVSVLKGRTTGRRMEACRERKRTKFQSLQEDRGQGKSKAEVQANAGAGEGVAVAQTMRRGKIFKGRAKKKGKVKTVPLERFWG